ncbi:hypothetical protein DP117_01655 [Brasilonema sp. UFV-L1]|nr:hypothetical protein [Brasilonema sp. UFV-L1]
MFSKGLNKQFVYLTTASITLTAVVVLSHTKNFYASSICVISNTASINKAVDSSLPKNTAYNFLDVVIDKSLN